MNSLTPAQIRAEAGHQASTMPRNPMVGVSDSYTAISSGSNYRNYQGNNNN